MFGLVQMKKDAVAEESESDERELSGSSLENGLNVETRVVVDGATDLRIRGCGGGRGRGPSRSKGSSGRSWVRNELGKS